jgi:hypothetical protein
MLRSNLVEETVEDVVSAGIASVDEELLAVNLSRETIRTLVKTVRDGDSPPRVRLLAQERPVKELMNDFLIASVAADLIDSDTMAIRTLEDVPPNCLFLADESVVSLVDGGASAAGLATTDDEFVATANEHYDDRWEAASAFSLRTPPISDVRETLTTDIGEGAAADFDTVLESLQTARGDGEGLDEVTISLLVAARNEELLYDISKWGEDVGLASKATFSRTKTRLEERGLVDTEKVPIDVGRPRLRLKLGDDRLNEADAEELASVARSLLAA